MGGRVALFLAWVLPLASVAQEVVEEEGSESRDSGGEVAGGPLDLSHLGQRPRPDGIEAASPFEYDPYWGLKESEFRLVPAGSARPRTEPEFARIPVPRWPGPAMVEAWDLGAAYTFPRLAPAIGAELFSFAGERRDQTVFGERVRLSFYFVELAFNAVGSVGGERLDRTDLDLDFRIPIRLGRKHRLALMPGSSFPMDGRDLSDDNTAIRFQVLYGFGGGGLGFQARVGFAQGSRPRSLLLLDEVVTDPAFLYGAMLLWRFVPGVQLRAEASGQIGRDGGTDSLTLLGGPVFFPLGDPRVSLGTVGIVQTQATELDFERPVWGGLVQVGVDFY